jgi:phage gp29-like protein
MATIPLVRRKTAPTTPKSVETAEEPAQAQEIAFRRTARDSGLAQVNYQATTLDVNRIQSALRAAERGQVWLLMTIIRDMTASFTHLQSEWNKRKMVICGQPLSLIPHPDDKDGVGVKVISEAIEHCRNWQEALKHLLDATLMPMSAAQKIYAPISLAERSRFKYLKNFWIKEIAPISYTLFSFDVPYRPAFVKTTNSAQEFNADDWESWLRFYSTEPNGAVNFGTQDIYKPDPIQHIIHRGNLLSPVIPPNFGGHIRAILFYWLLITQDRDWWALMMAKYGMPIPVAKVNDNNKQTMADMRQALSLGTQLGGIAIPKNATLEWSGAVGTDGSNSHKIFSDFCNGEVSKIVVGQITSSRPEKGGMAAGMAEQSEAVRNDVRVWDVSNLAWTLKNQLFRQVLDLNGYQNIGTPTPFWGGLAPGDLATLGKSLNSFYLSGVRLTPEGIVSLSERSGLSFEQIPDAVMNPSPAVAGGDKNKKIEKE